jgi:ABC-type nickel/cobalt efflux system permease component RcnA
MLGVAGAICVAAAIVSLAALYRARRRRTGPTAVYAATASPLLVLALALWAVWRVVQRNGTWGATPVNPDVITRSLSLGALAGIPLGAVGAALLLRAREESPSGSPSMAVRPG